MHACMCMCTTHDEYSDPTSYACSYSYPGRPLTVVRRCITITPPPGGNSKFCVVILRALVSWLWAMGLWALCGMCHCVIRGPFCRCPCRCPLCVACGRACTVVCGPADVCCNSSSLRHSHGQYRLAIMLPVLATPTELLPNCPPRTHSPCRRASPRFHHLSVHSKGARIFGLPFASQAAYNWEEWFDASQWAFRLV